MNSEYVFTSEESFLSVAYSSHSSFNFKVILVPRTKSFASLSDASRMVYEVESILDSQVHAFPSSFYFDVTFTVSATKNDE